MCTRHISVLTAININLQAELHTWPSPRGRLSKDSPISVTTGFLHWKINFSVLYTVLPQTWLSYVTVCDHCDYNPVRWKCTQVTSGLHMKYIYWTTTTSLSGSPTSWQVRKRHGPSLRERGSLGSLPDCSRWERSKIKHITQGLYRKKLAFIDAKTLCQQA